jgi:hypothetical protein
MMASALQILSTPRCCGLLVGWLLAATLADSWVAVQAQQRTPRAAPSGRRGAAPREPESNALSGARTTQAAPRSVTFTAEREAAALTFVRANRPELVAVLEELKGGNPAEYERAICDLFWTSETLATIRQDDPRRYDLALRTWQLETRTHLLASQIAGRPVEAERLRSELAETVQQLVDAQLETSVYDVRRLEAQLRRAQDRHQRLAGRRDELVRERMSALAQAIEQAGSSQNDRP